jgi:hypothetical protein
VSVQRTIGRLEDLLQRIQRNAAKPRPARMAAPEAEAEVEEEVVIDEPVIEATSVDFGSPPALEVSEPVEPEPIEELELLDEEEFEDLTEEEEPPASSRRPKAASSMDEALAGAAEQLDMDEGREIRL